MVYFQYFIINFLRVFISNWIEFLLFYLKLICCWIVVSNIWLRFKFIHFWRSHWRLQQVHLVRNRHLFKQLITTYFFVSIKKWLNLINWPNVIVFIWGFINLWFYFKMVGYFNILTVAIQGWLRIPFMPNWI